MVVFIFFETLAQSVPDPDWFHLDYEPKLLQIQNPYTYSYFFSIIIPKAVYRIHIWLFFGPR